MSIVFILNANEVNLTCVHRNSVPFVYNSRGKGLLYSLVYSEVYSEEKFTLGITAHLCLTKTYRIMINKR